MGVAINTLNKMFDERGAVIEEISARQLGILVNQRVDFARVRGAQAKEIA